MLTDLRYAHWLVTVPFDATTVRIYAATSSYYEAMSLARRADHPTRRATVALYTDAWIARNGRAGMRVDGLVSRDAIECVDQPAIDRVVTRAESESPLALLATYAGAVRLWWGDDREVIVGADCARWVWSSGLSTPSGLASTYTDATWDGPVGCRDRVRA